MRQIIRVYLQFDQKDPDQSLYFIPRVKICKIVLALRLDVIFQFFPLLLVFKYASFIDDTEHVLLEFLVCLVE